MASIRSRDTNTRQRSTTRQSNFTSTKACYQRSTKSIQHQTCFHPQPSHGALRKICRLPLRAPLHTTQEQYTPHHKNSPRNKYTNCEFTLLLKRCRQNLRDTIQPINPYSSKKRKRQGTNNTTRKATNHTNNSIRRSVSIRHIIRPSPQNIPHPTQSAPIRQLPRHQCHNRGQLPRRQRTSKRES